MFSTYALPACIHDRVGSKTASLSVKGNKLAVIRESAQLESIIMYFSEKRKVVLRGTLGVRHL